MKEKIMYLIIGILIGAVITAGGFLVFGKNRNKMEGGPARMQMDGNSAGEKFRGDGNMTPPEGNMVPQDNNKQTDNSTT